LYDFFILKPPVAGTKVLFIFDVDVKKTRPEENGVYYFNLPVNLENEKVDSGIENMFPEDLVKPFLCTETDSEGNVIKTRLDPKKKKKLEEIILASTDATIFAKFEALVEKIKSFVETEEPTKLVSNAP